MSFYSASFLPWELKPTDFVHQNWCKVNQNMRFAQFLNPFSVFITKVFKLLYDDLFDGIALTQYVEAGDECVRRADFVFDRSGF